MKLQLTNDRKFLKVIEATNVELDQAKLYFTREIENARFDPRVKLGIWNGTISYMQGVFIPAGLWNEVLRMGRMHGILTEVYGLDLLKNGIDRDEFDAYFEDLFENAEKKPRPYQMDAAYKILTNVMSNSEIATSAGKTLIMFMTVAWMVQKMGMKRVLIVVPRTQLVTQCLEDFQEYCDREKFQYFAKGIKEGSKESVVSANVVVGTWQSLIKREEDLFLGSDALVVDEAHHAKSASIKTIVSKCTNARVRYGLSGTIDQKGGATDFTVQQYLGPVIQKITPDFLIQNNYATPVKVKQIYLSYLPQEERERLMRAKAGLTMSGAEIYNAERTLVTESQARFGFIAQMVSGVTKNTLVMFSDVKNGYGRRFYDYLRETVSDKEVFYVDGSTLGKNRDFYKKKMEQGENKVMVASFGTTSTGISIKNVHNIFMVEGFKSSTIIKQTIGRGMRQHGTKEFVNIIDFVDDFTVGRYKNILVKHAEDRMKIYNEEKFPVQQFSVQL